MHQVFAQQIAFTESYTSMSSLWTGPPSYKNCAFVQYHCIGPSQRERRSRAVNFHSCPPGIQQTVAGIESKTPLPLPLGPSSLSDSSLVRVLSIPTQVMSSSSSSCSLSFSPTNSANDHRERSSHSISLAAHCTLQKTMHIDCIPMCY